MIYPIDELNEILGTLPVPVQEYILSDDVSRELESTIDVFQIKPEDQDSFRNHFLQLLLGKIATSDFTDYLQHELKFNEEDAEEILLYLDDMLFKSWDILEKSSTEVESQEEASHDSPAPISTPVAPTPNPTPEEHPHKKINLIDTPVFFPEASPRPAQTSPSIQKPIEPSTALPEGEHLLALPADEGPHATPTPAVPQAPVAPMPQPEKIESAKPSQPPMSMLDKKLSAPANHPSEEVVWGKTPTPDPKKPAPGASDPYREPPTA